MNGLRIAVVGAGIGGLTTATALAGSAHEIRVFDRARGLADVGAGIQLTPNSTRLLTRLGVLRRLPPDATVHPAATEIRRWHDAAPLARTMLGPACSTEYGAPYVTVRRTDLQTALLDAVGRDRVFVGHRVTSVQESDTGVTLYLADGSVHEADVVIGADGIQSTVRRHVSGDSPVFSGYLIHRGMVPAAALPPGFALPRITVWIGPGRHCVHYPVLGGRWISFAATVPGADPGPGPATSTGWALREAFAGWAPALRTLLGRAETVGLWPLFDRDPLATWSTGRTTLAGDAAHPMLPFMAQGANQAVEDGATLGAVLAGAGTADVRPGLERYQRLRSPRTRRVVLASRHNASLMHDDRPRDAPVRTTGLTELRRLAWLYGHDAELVASHRGRVEAVT